MPTIYKIALPIPSKILFSYTAKDDSLENVIGRRAFVEFGKRNLTGIIIDVEKEVADSPGLKPILELLDEEPVFSGPMLKFINWIAEYYVASVGETLKAALPQGMAPQSIMKVKILQIPSDEELTRMAKKAPKRAELLIELLEHDDFISVKYLERQLNSKIVSESLQALEAMGIIECSREAGPEIQPKMQKALSISDDFEMDISRVRGIFDELDKAAPKQSLLLSHIYLSHLSGKTKLLQSEVLRQTGVSSAAINGLVKKGYITESIAEVDRNIIETENSLGSGDESLLELTEEQQYAFDTIRQAIADNHNAAFLLHGVTGSGKTLVYIHAIKDVIAGGRNVLLLLPEISLTPQLIDRFEQVFPGEISSLHSRMSQGERFDSWRKIKSGKAKIVIGARSAIFAPINDLGLIIVDEEHEFNFKQDDPAPRYHARDCALVRAKMEDAIIVLGSATPSLESMYNAITGKYKLLEIKQRADNAKMPAISFVDTIGAKKEHQMSGSFSNYLLKEIAVRIGRKEGVILFQNRRGFSSFLECSDCGHVPMCQHCDVTLTFHKVRRQLRCHYCGYTISADKSCRACGDVKLNEVGTGTQKVEEELAEALDRIDSPAKIVRVDLDTTSRRGAYRKIMQDFKSGKTDILIGTQMVAKGLDFERVTLVGVINADLQLFLPDFRASERTFQLLTQVAGRAGRSYGKRGHVIIQTAHHDNFAISKAISGNYGEFYRHEIQHRENVKFPPFVRFVQIEFTGKDENLVHTLALKFSGILPKSEKSVAVLPNFIPRVSKIRDKYRRIIIIKNDRAADPGGRELRSVLDYTVGQYNKLHGTSKVRFTIDIDSYSSL